MFRFRHVHAANTEPEALQTVHMAEDIRSAFPSYQKFWIYKIPGSVFRGEHPEAQINLLHPAAQYSYTDDSSHVRWEDPG